jgi:hypothetical protein
MGTVVVIGSRAKAPDASASHIVGMKALPGWSSFFGWHFWPSMRVRISDQTLNIETNPRYIGASILVEKGLLPQLAIPRGEVLGVTRRQRSIEIAVRDSTTSLIVVAKPTRRGASALEQSLQTWLVGG